MTSLLGARRRAEEFAAFVDGRTARSSLDAGLSELVAVVEALRAHEAPAPRPEFAAALRERLLAEAQTSVTTGSVLRLPPRPSGTRERRLALLAASVVLVGGTAGIAAASQRALPGEALYPIKRGIERAQVEVGTSTTGRGHQLLEQADGRLVEARGLMEESEGSPLVPGTIEQFVVQAAEGADLLLASFEEDRDPAVIEELHTFTADALGELEELAGLAPADHQDELARAASTVLEIDRRAAASCASCLPESGPLQMPGLFLTASDAEPEAVRGLTENDDHPTLSVDAGQRSEQGDRSGASAGDQPAAGGEPPQQPGAPDLPAAPRPPQDPGVQTPADVVDDGSTEGPLDEADETADELLPEDLDPPSDPAVPGTGSPPNPETGSPPGPGTGSPTEPGTGSLTEPGTGSLTEPGTGSLTEPGTGSLTDPVTGQLPLLP